MDDITKILTAVFGGVIVIAIAAVIVSRKSQAPQAIQSIGSAIGNVVASAVNPVSANYGYGTGSQAGTSPGGGSVSDLSSLFPQFSSAANIPDLSAIIPGGSK